jgi:hypothetical protein
MLSTLDIPKWRELRMSDENGIDSSPWTAGKSVQGIAKLR